MGRAAVRSAGFLVFASSTGRMLLVRRSSRSKHPGTWGIPGGRLERGEGPLEGAWREFREEVGRAPLTVGQAVQARQYITFVADTPTEFTPALNWEHSAWMWCDPRAGLPTPLHDGVERVVALPWHQLERLRP